MITGWSTAGKRFSSSCASRTASRIPSVCCSRFEALPPTLPRPLRGIGGGRQLILRDTRHVVARDLRGGFGRGLRGTLEDLARAVRAAARLAVASAVVGNGRRGARQRYIEHVRRQQ